MNRPGRAVPPRCHWLALLLAALLAGCAGAPGGQPVATAPSGQTGSGTAAQDPAYALLQQAETAASPQKETLLLQAAGLYRERGDDARLGRVLQELQLPALQDDNRLAYALLAGERALRQQRLPDAAVLLTDKAAQSAVKPAQAQRWHALRAELFTRQQQSVDAVRERLAQSLATTDPAAQRDVGEAIWRLLLQLSPADFALLENADTSNRAEEQLLAGWLALARLQRNGTADPARQRAALEDWQRSWPVHPANRYMPADMAMLEASAGNVPHHIALLLPLTGKRAEAGRAVRDGFLAQHYRQMAVGGNAVLIDLIDTGAASNLLAVYQQAVAQGAQLVIGPLEREQVQQLAVQSGLPVPTLALNNALNPLAVSPTDLFQLSLNPEDDVTQAADRAAANGYRRALAIAPAGDRGERLLQAFQRRWTAIGGEVSGNLRYEPDTGNYSLPLAQALGLDLASGQLQPGRQWPDAVFFIGNGTDAALMMETLSRNGAGQLPVYTTAQVLGSTPRPGWMTRAEGLRLCVAPWQAGRGPLREAGEALPVGTDSLFALGADAGELYPKLSVMRSNPSLRVTGNTGFLSVDENHRVLRQLACGALQGGQLQIEPVAAGYGY